MTAAITRFSSPGRWWPNVGSGATTSGPATNCRSVPTAWPPPRASARRCGGSRWTSWSSGRHGSSASGRGRRWSFDLPAGTADLVTPWYERARPVAELAVRTWVQASPNDDELARAAHRWVKDLANACAGAGEPLAIWFEKSRVAASVAMGRRVGLTVPPRSRPPYGGDAEAHQHAI